MNIDKRLTFVLLLAAFVTACADQKEGGLPKVYAAAETAPVKSNDDAADDPAIWVNINDPAASKILGTDKQAGLYVYGLEGNVLQFLEVGELNNVDLRQGAMIGDRSGDFAVATNRTDNTIAVFQISTDVVDPIGSFPSIADEPYGVCLAEQEQQLFTVVTHKTGELIIYRLDALDATQALYRPDVVAQLKLDTQLEGCVHDDATGTLYIGEETAGIWKVNFNGSGFYGLKLIDKVGGENGIAADVEGLSLYKTEDQAFLVASSQGNNSFALYDLADDSFIGRFEIAAGKQIDGAEETDGIETVSVSLGEEYPQGLLVVQDGHNKPDGEAQNFKLVDWRDVDAALQLSDRNAAASGEAGD